MKPDPLQPAAVHLSPDDLDAVFLGIATPQTAAHAATCPTCALHLQSFGSTVGLFNQASLAWAEAKSNTINRDLAAHRPHPVLTLAAARSYVAALLVAVFVTLTAGVHRRALTLEAANSFAIAAPFDSTQDEIASDNAMLQAIDSEIRRPDPLPAVLAENTQASTSQQVRN